MIGLSPIAARQRALYGAAAHPLFAMNPRFQAGQTRNTGRLGYLGLTTNQAIGAAGSAASGAKVGGIAGSAAAAGLSAVGAGALAGSVVPLVGTAIGALIGLVASGVFNKTDPEIATWDAAGRNWQANADSVFNIANKYIVLAGLFDLHPSQIKGNIPIYKKYGRMGEYAFTRDMAQKVYDAAQAGVIGPSDTPATVMQKVVQPWIDSWGFGPMQDMHADMINRLIIGLIMDYISGNHTVWRDVKGGWPFAGLPKFSLPQPQQLAPSSPAAQQMQLAPASQQMLVPASSIPAGFTLVGQLNGQAAYQGSDGRFYQWTGAQMVLGTGSLMTPNGTIAVSGGLMAGSPGNAAAQPPQPPSQYAQLDPGTVSMIQQALAQGASGQQAAQYAVNAGVPPAQATQAVQAVTAGATGAGLPPWATYVGIGAGVLMLVFALARPAGRARGSH